MTVNACPLNIKSLTGSEASVDPANNFLISYHLTLFTTSWLGGGGTVTLKAMIRTRNPTTYNVVNKKMSFIFRILDGKKLMKNMIMQAIKP
jgi:hypothetical protein